MLERKPASATAQQLDDNASKQLAAHRKERELRSGPLLDRLRIGELKTIAEDARAAGDIDNRVADERLFECALPHLLALPTITRRGFKGAGDLGQFAHDFAPAFYRSKGSRYFDDLRHEFDTVLKMPRRMKADHIAHRLGITLAKRAQLGLQTIGASDKPKAEPFEARFGVRVELTFASEADIAPPDEDVLMFVEEKLLRFRAERLAEREAEQVAAPPTGRRVHFVSGSDVVPACGAIAPRRGARVTAEPVQVTRTTAGRRPRPS